MARKKKSKWKIAALVLIAVLVAFRLSLPTLAKRYVNKQLNLDPLYHGKVDEVRIHLWRGAYSLRRLAVERVEGQKEFPLVSADEIDIGVSWKELLHAALRLKLTIKGLVVNIVQERESGEKKVAIGQDSTAGKKGEAETWKGTLEKLVPIDLGQLRVEGESMHFRDLTSKPEIDVYLDQLTVEGQNLTNSAKISKSLFGTIDLRARMMKSGQLHVVALLNPLSSPPELKITTQLDGLELTELNPFFEAYGNFDVKGGTMGISSEMATADNNIKGYVKPILKDLKVSDLSKDVKKGGVIHAAWEVIVGAVGGIFKSHAKGQQAARIAFQGRLDDPKTSGWEIAKSVLYNAFIKPIDPRIENSVKLSNVKRPKTPNG